MCEEKWKGYVHVQPPRRLGRFQVDCIVEEKRCEEGAWESVRVGQVMCAWGMVSGDEVRGWQMAGTCMDCEIQCVHAESATLLWETVRQEWAGQLVVLALQQDLRRTWMSAKRDRERNLMK